MQNGAGEVLIFPTPRSLLRSIHTLTHTHAHTHTYTHTHTNTRTHTEFRSNIGVVEIVVKRDFGGKPVRAGINSSSGCVLLGLCPSHSVTPNTPLSSFLCAVSTDGDVFLKGQLQLCACGVGWIGIRGWCYFRREGVWCVRASRMGHESTHACSLGDPNVMITAHDCTKDSTHCTEIPLLLPLNPPAAHTHHTHHTIKHIMRVVKDDRATHPAVTSGRISCACRPSSESTTAPSYDGSNTTLHTWCVCMYVGIIHDDMNHIEALP